MTVQELAGVFLVVGLCFLPLWCAVACLILAALFDDGPGSADGQG
jgi:hypothetical protein